MSRDKAKYTMYENILRLPLFQGLGEDDLTSLLEKMKFVFRRYSPGETIASKGEELKGLRFFFNGTLLSVLASENPLYRVTEKHTQPMALEPSSLFGILPEYRRDYIAESNVDTLFLSKKHVIEDLSDYAIFRVNFFNLLCRRIQETEEKKMEYFSSGARNKITTFFFSQILRVEGPKLFKINMTELAEIIDETRLKVSDALNTMSSEGIIDISRGSILIPDMTKLKI